MSERDDRTASELGEDEERRRRGLPALDEEIARKYDPARLSRTVLAGAGRGERLDLATRGEMERLHPGHDFSEVRVFRGALAEEVNRRHGADAVTIANTGMILVRESARSSPGTTSGRALLAHEVTHVAQAQRGLHFALEGGGGEGDHEHEAEAVERQVASGGEAAKNPAEGASREAARRAQVTERVFELLDELHFLHQLRSGH
jgi:hypothetical protein